MCATKCDLCGLCANCLSLQSFRLGEKWNDFQVRFGFVSSIHDKAASKMLFSITHEGASMQNRTQLNWIWPNSEHMIEHGFRGRPCTDVEKKKKKISRHVKAGEKALDSDAVSRQDECDFVARLNSHSHFSLTIVKDYWDLFPEACIIGVSDKKKPLVLTQQM